MPVLRSAASAAARSPFRLCRWAVVAFAALLLVAAYPAEAWAQEIEAIKQQVEVDLHGPDRQGKDGPLATVGARLATLYRAHEAHQKRGSLDALRPPSSAMQVRDGTVVIDATASGSGAALRADLERLGLTHGARAGRLVSGRLPISAIPELAELESLQAARPALAMTHAGAVTTQGDAAMRADVAREELGVDGNGITVGVMSDSYNTNLSASTTASDDIESGDLPPEERITVLEDFDDGTDEGRAMMQIIHDVAPGANLAYHTAFGGQATFAEGIHALADAGAEVIVDDVIYFTEPMFQDGLIAEAANEVVRNQGVAYFSSAGNNGRNSYESPFQPSGEPGVLDASAELHDFGGGDTDQEIIIPEDDSIRIVLQWTDPYGSFGSVGAESDVDIFLQDQSGNVVARSDFGNVGNDPVEFLEFSNDGSIDADNDGTPDERFFLGMELFEGPAPELIKYVYFPSQGVAINEFIEETQNPSLFGHANAAEAAAIGAVFWFATPAFDDQFTNPFAVNSFSSVGGVPIHFTPEGDPLPSPQVRQKPDMVGPDGGNNTFFGQELNDGDDFPNFFGTSAAAPHVAAVAALMLEFDPDRAPAQVYDDLQETAIDMDQVLVDGEAEPVPDGEGFDFYSGFGLVQADEAVPQSAAVVSFQATRAGGGNTVEVSWEETGTEAIEEFVLEQQYFDAPFDTVATVPSEGNPQFSIETENLGLGQYTYRLSWRRPDGTTETSPQWPTITVDLIDFTAEVVGDNANDVQLDWTVPSATTGYTYTIQYRSGGSFQEAGSTTGQSFTVESLRPGQYDFRLRMRDEQGNVLSSRTITDEVPFDGEVAVSPVYPNPFQHRMQFDITARSEQTVQVRVYNTAGRLVHYQFETLEPLIPRTITVTPRNLASGKYFIQVRGDGYTETREVVRVR